MSLDDEVKLTRDLLLPALSAELSDKQNDGSETTSSADRTLTLLRDLADPELDERDQEQTLVGWLADALSN